MLSFTNLMSTLFLMFSMVLPNTELFISLKKSFSTHVKDESVTNTSEIQVALKEFVKNALDHLDEYNIPKLKCKVLGHHLENLRSVLHEIGETPLDGKICSRIIRCSNPGKEPPQDELTSEQKQIKIDIVYTIGRELSSFPGLNFSECAFDDYFEKIGKNP